jgi:hypothetical protein
MTTKDYIYLGLILLTALAFYCNGFYAGVYRCKRMYDTLLDDGEVNSEEASGKFLAINDKELSFRSCENPVPQRALRGDFGKN